MRHFERHESELPPCSHEDVDIDDQHDHQGKEHTAKEIEIDHVVQGNHSLKQALGHSFSAALTLGDSGGRIPTCAREAKVKFLIMLTIE